MVARMLHVLPDHAGGLISAAQRRGQGDIHRLLALGLDRFKDPLQHRRSSLGGLGKFPLSEQQLIKLILTQINILLIFRIAKGHAQGDAGHAQLFVFLWLKVRSGVGNDMNHISFLAVHSK